MSEYHEADLPETNSLLTTLSVFAILLGLMGLLAVVMGGVMFLLQDRIEQGQKRHQQNLPAQMRQSQQKMNAEIKQVTEKWKYFSYASLTLKFFLAGSLIVGGVQAFRLTRGGRTLLLIAFIAGLVLEGLSLVPTLLIQNEMNAITSTHMKEMMKNGPGGAIFDISMKIGLVIAFGWIALKFFFYGFGTWYMQRQNMIDLFQRRRQRNEFEEDDR